MELVLNPLSHKPDISYVIDAPITLETAMNQITEKKVIILIDEVDKGIVDALRAHYSMPGYTTYAELRSMGKLIYDFVESCSKDETYPS